MVSPMDLLDERADAQPATRQRIRHTWSSSHAGSPPTGVPAMRRWWRLRTEVDTVGAGRTRGAVGASLSEQEGALRVLTDPLGSATGQVRKDEPGDCLIMRRAMIKDLDYS